MAAVGIDLKNPNTRMLLLGGAALVMYLQYCGCRSAADEGRSGAKTRGVGKFQHKNGAFSGKPDVSCDHEAGVCARACDRYMASAQRDAARGEASESAQSEELYVRARKCGRGLKGRCGAVHGCKRFPYQPRRA